MVITRAGSGLARFDFQYNALLVEKIKKIPGRNLLKTLWVIIGQPL